MSLMVDADRPNGRKKFDVPAEGPHKATLTQIKDLGMQETKFGPKHRVRFIWQLDETSPTGQRLLAFQSYNLTFDRQSFLFKAVKTLLGQEPPAKFDLDTLIGVKAIVVIEHNVGPEGTTYANVVTVIRSGGLRGETLRGGQTLGEAVRP